MAGRRRWVFRLAALLFPLLVLALLELALRWAGYGYATHFFLGQHGGDRAELTDNERFGWRFFPPAMARTPEPFSILGHPLPSTYRIFVLGESAARGDPELAFGFGRMIQVLLQERYPATHFEVVNTAMTAINSHVIRSIAGDCAGQTGDLWLIYMGNNEVVGPFGAGTVFGAEVPPLPMIRTSLALKTTRIGQGLDAIWQRWFKPDSQHTSWGGMEMFLNKQVPEHDPRMAKVYGHFAQNLRAILQNGNRTGVKQIVCTVGCNLKDCAPFGSQHGGGFNPAKQAEWKALFTNGIAAESAGRFAEAIDCYSRATDMDPGYAEVAFRWGHCLGEMGRTAEARNRFELARDLDTLRFRADRRINQIIAQAATGRTNEAIYFLDAASLLATHSPQGIAGEEFFYEHVHLKFEGNYLIARAAAELIAQLLSREIAAQSAGDGWLSSDECAQRLGWNDWSRSRVWQDMHRRLLDPPFNQQPGHQVRMARLESQMADLSARLGPEGLQQAVRQFRGALAKATNDWVLHDKLGELLRDAGDVSGAMEQWEAVAHLLPHYPLAYNNLGFLCNRMGKAVEAEKRFSQALQLRPEFLEALNGMGLALTTQRRFTEAVACFERALRRKPDSVGTRINFAVTLEGQGNLPDAHRQFREALRVDPNNGVAHANLGRLMALQGNIEEATRHFSEAMRLMPKSAPAHFSLGTSLMSQGHFATAANEFAAAVELDPKFAEARVNWGAALLKQGNLTEALRRLAEAVQLNPQSVNAHLCLGLALQQQGNLEEAILHFRQAASLDPAHPQTRTYLDNALGRAANPDTSNHFERPKL